MVFAPGASPVRVRWFFTDLPPLDFPSAFMSSNWDGDFDTVPDIGEVRDKRQRKYYRGDPPPVDFSGVPCGELARWQGDPAALAVAPGAATGISVWGTRTCCALTPLVCPDLTQLPKYDPNLLYALAVSVWATQAQNLVALILCGEGLLRDGAPTAREVRYDIYRPTWNAWWNSREALVTIAGTMGEEQLLAQVLETIPGPVPAGGFGVGFFWLRAAELVGRELYASGLPLDVPITFAGHSLGGDVASILAVREKQLRPGRTVRCATFGEPRTGDSRFAALAEDRHERIETDADMVALLPPDFGLFGWLFSLFGVSLLTKWAKFVRTSPGRRIDAAGTLTVSDDGRGIFGDLPDLMTTIAAHDPFTLPPLHLLPSYCTRLGAAAAAAVPSVSSICMDMSKIIAAHNLLQGLIPPPTLIAPTVRAAAGPASYVNFIIATIIHSTAQVAVRATTSPATGYYVASTARMMVAPSSSLATGFAITPASRLATRAASSVSELIVISPYVSIAMRPAAIVSASVFITVSTRLGMAAGASITPPPFVVLPSLRCAMRPSSPVSFQYLHTDTLSAVGDGLYTVPVGVDSLQVVAIAGGGRGTGVGGGVGQTGGGGGAFAAAVLSVVAGTDLAYHVGGGGGRAGNDNDPDGDDTFFVDVMTVLAKGGLGGSNAGTGGQSAACIGDLVFSGGDGATFAGEGGGGGSAAWNSQDGNPGVDDAGGLGDGISGAGGQAHAGGGDTGDPYGGGGGGSDLGVSTGLGGNGVIQVFWFGA